MDSDELTSRFDRAVQSEPHRVILSFQEWHRHHTNLALEHYGRYIKQFEDFFGLITELLEYVNYYPKNGWPSQRSTQFILMVENLSGLYCGFDLLVRGHYFESMSLLRGVYEAVIKVLYLTYHPEDTWAPFMYIKQKGVRQFQLETFLKHELRVDWSSIWRLASGASHSNNLKVILKRMDIRKGTTPAVARLELKWNLKHATMPMNLSYFCLWLYLIEYEILFATPAPKELPAEYLTKMLEIKYLLGEWARTSRNMYAGMYTDVKRIAKEFKLMETRDYLGEQRRALISLLSLVNLQQQDK